LKERVYVYSEKEEIKTRTNRTKALDNRDSLMVACLR
jgi:hypothetical protein